jgi:hypothetical protein
MLEVVTTKSKKKEVKIKEKELQTNDLGELDILFVNQPDGKHMHREPLFSNKSTSDFKTYHRSGFPFDQDAPWFASTSIAGMCGGVF